MEKGVSYLRVSCGRHLSGDVFALQREAIARYAKAHNIDVVGEFRDEGVSGTQDLDHRHGLSDLMARIRSNGVRLVLVNSADRLARDVRLIQVLLAEFRKLGAAVVATDSGTDLTAGGRAPGA